MLVKVNYKNMKTILRKFELERERILKIIDCQLEKDNKHLKFSFITIGNEK